MCWDLLLFRVWSAVSFFSAVFIDWICVAVQVLVLCCIGVEFLQLTLHRVHSVIQLCEIHVTVISLSFNLMGVGVGGCLISSVHVIWKIGDV